ncbi:uncharacterized protein [Amphiura filiformis]|uniref:uncharacterized protein n=1 Tax=Amphiura filiformis TaxID=82378 RepID=UPI003B2164CC
MEWRVHSVLYMQSGLKYLMVCIVSVILVIGFSEHLLFSTHLTWQPVDRSSVREIQHEDHNSLSTIDNRPLLVLGILSADLNSDFRNASRSTWLSTVSILQDTLPFRIIYKFLLDQPTNDTIVENDKYNDILFLNDTHQGRAVKFGYKLYVWYKYIYETYPEALLVAKLDDDVFLCVPQLLKRLNELKSTKLYYGLAHENKKATPTGIACIDEMFVVVGKDLSERIARRKYCAEQCNATIDLIDTNYGGSSLGSWLSIYDDVDFQPDNNRIIHRPIGRGLNSETSVLENIKPDFCSKYVIHHKSSVQVMKQLHEYKPVLVSDAVTGSIFSGDIVQKLLPMPSLTTHHNAFAIMDKMPGCDNWAVVTTINYPTKAVKSMASLPNWCLVIVADTKTPLESTYLSKIGMKNNSNYSKIIKYLSVKEQTILYPLLSEIIPLNSFGRKNIGYMYAIHHKAKLIWDFDDDNDGIADLNDFKKPFDHVKVCKHSQNILLNPYPYFGDKETRTWPRGFPLQYIKSNETLPKLCTSRRNVQLGILQSLANNQPDVDAIYRMTRDVPFNFRASPTSHRPLVLPRGTYAPFNAQATLWFAPAFAYMALPLSVNGRVSDIWRSYIAQYFLHSKNIRLAFSSPYVIQDRNAHDILRDFNAELDLYQKSKQFVEFLSLQQYSFRQYDKLDFVELYKQLYTRQYIEQLDIQFAEAWTKTLASITESA